ncbi:MAG TPA: hypothetical protein VET65_11710 [Candidatus Limnocylindrales bacterium]|nr:hypothetical protein [Candidatus Limnocylindrales bacterium]
MRRQAAAATLGLGLLLAALLHGVSSAPPLYDGLPLPQAPYDYCNPPASLRSSNKPPDKGQATFPVQNGQVLGGGVQTLPDAQVVVFIGVDALRGPAGTSAVVVSIDPVCQNPPPPPAGGQILGNVYRISAVALPGKQPVSIGAPYRITIRYPSGNVRDVELYDGSSWHPLRSTLAPSGNPYVGAVVPSLGEVAVIGHSAAPDSLLTVITRYLEGFGVLALVIIFGIIALVQEIRRRRKRA